MQTPLEIVPVFDLEHRDFYCGVMVGNAKQAASDTKAVGFTETWEGNKTESLN